MTKTEPHGDKFKVLPPGGKGRRQIDLRLVSEDCAVGWLEDDFHHFGVTLTHDGDTVTDVRMAAPRTPWTACPGASDPLKALIGKPLITRASDIGGLIEMRKQCTHVFDLTGLLLAHIANRKKRSPHRRYHAVIDDRERFSEEETLASFGTGAARLYQDGEQVLHWSIDGDMITGPQSCAGRCLNQGFRAWTESMPEPEAEYATIMRRAILIAGGRTINHDAYPTAADQVPGILCHASQPGIRETAYRCYGKTRDYSADPENMLIYVHEIP